MKSSNQSLFAPLVSIFTVAVLFLGFGFVQLEAKPGVYKKDSKSAIEKIEALDLVVREQLFATATQLLNLLRDVGFAQLKEARKELKSTDLSSLNSLLHSYQYNELSQLGDMGPLLATLLKAHSNSKKALFDVVELKQIQKEFQSYEPSLEDVAMIDVINAWKASLPRSERMSNNEFFDFRTLIKAFN